MILDSCQPVHANNIHKNVLCGLTFIRLIVPRFVGAVCFLISYSNDHKNYTYYWTG